MTIPEDTCLHLVYHFALIMLKMWLDGRTDLSCELEWAREDWLKRCSRLSKSVFKLPHKCFVLHFLPSCTATSRVWWRVYLLVAFFSSSLHPAVPVRTTHKQTLRQVESKHYDRLSQNITTGWVQNITPSLAKISRQVFRQILPQIRHYEKVQTLRQVESKDYDMLSPNITTCRVQTLGQVESKKWRQVVF